MFKALENIVNVVWPPKFTEGRGTNRKLMDGFSFVHSTYDMRPRAHNMPLIATEKSYDHGLTSEGHVR